jgi:hypothetical protein
MILFGLCSRDIIDINPAVYLELLESPAYVPKYAPMDLKLKRRQ